MPRYKVAIELKGVFEKEFYACSEEYAEHLAETYLHQEQPHLEWGPTGPYTVEQIDEK